MPKRVRVFTVLWARPGRMATQSRITCGRNLFQLSLSLFLGCTLDATYCPTPAVVWACIARDGAGPTTPV